MTIEITFHGGPVDGLVRLQGFNPHRRPDGELEQYAWMFFSVTAGEVGRGMIGLCPAVITVLRAPVPEMFKNNKAQQHKYVIDRRADGPELIAIHAQYVQRKL